jgi:uncharacterized membrane protein YkoI
MMPKLLVTSLIVAALFLAGTRTEVSAARLIVANAGDAGAAAQQAAAATGGRVLDVRRGVTGGRAVYFVKVLLDDGRVKMVRIDGPSGPADGR